MAEPMTKGARPPWQRADLWVDGLLGLVLVAAVLRFVVPPAQGWYHDDDFHNLRWVLEYRDEPWKAFTERHAVHDHVRPMTLLSIWAGAALSSGAYAGPYLVQALLHVLGLAGVVALAWELGAGRRGALLAGLLAAGTAGFARTLEWNAWMNSTGETCFGFWSLYAASRSLRSPRWLAAAVGFVLLAGLYKEPGWVVYPAGAVALAVGALVRDRRSRPAWALVSLVGVGALGFAWTFHPANVVRAEEVERPMTEVVGRFLYDLSSALFDGWPLWVGRVADGDAGLWLPLVLVALAQGVLGTLAARPLGRLAWMYGTAGLVAVGLSRPAWAGLLVVVLLVVAIARNFRAPPAPLVVALVSLVVMVPFGNVHEVQILAAGYGLAVYTAGVLAGLLREGGGGFRLAVLVGGLLAAVPVGRIAQRLVGPLDDRRFAGLRAEEARVLGFGAVARTLGTGQGQVSALSDNEQEILPLVGVKVSNALEFGVSPTVSIGGKLLLCPPSGAMEQTLLATDVLRGVYLPQVEDSPRGEPQLRPSRGEEPSSAEKAGTEVEVAPGFYALGIGAAQGVSAGLALRAQDTCGHTWVIEQDARLPVPFTLDTVYLEPGCGPLRVAWVGSGKDPRGIAFLSPLEPGRFDLWGPRAVERVMTVDPTQTSWHRPQEPPGEAAPPDADVPAAVPTGP